MNIDPSFAAMQLAWNTAPIGMAVINDQGVVCAVNPVFEQFVEFTDAGIFTMSESDFLALLDRSGFEHRRVKSTQVGLRAIHYVRAPSAQVVAVERDLRKIAEALREPLASIYGFSELLLTQNYDFDTRQNLTATLLEQVEVLSNIINDRLDDRARQRAEQQGNH